MTEAAQRGHVLRLLRIERNVCSLEHSLAFYHDALGFEVAEPARSPAGTCRSALLRLGNQHIGLTELNPSGACYPPGGNAADLWFQHIAIVASDIEAACRRLELHDPARISRGGPQRLPPETGCVTAFKFRDPDGHPLELIHFPSGTGDRRWQRDEPGDPTIGIDHTAISVSNAEASVAFYRDLIGLTLESRQINRGIGQENLDGLHDDIVEVVTLAPEREETPHLELLAYRIPGGRAMPVHPRDIAADRIILQVDDLDAVFIRLSASLPPDRLKYDGATLWVHDPDGHLICCTV